MNYCPFCGAKTTLTGTSIDVACELDTYECSDCKSEFEEKVFDVDGGKEYHWTHEPKPELGEGTHAG